MDIHVELLLGRRVRDSNGAIAGRIESILARREGKECVVEEFDLGAAALLSVLGISVVRLIGWPRSVEPLRVPWQQMDLSDPEHPRLRCPREEIDPT